MGLALGTTAAQPGKPGSGCPSLACKLPNSQLPPAPSLAQRESSQHGGSAAAHAAAMAAAEDARVDLGLASPFAKVSGM